jgi:hypothetical protein
LLGEPHRRRQIAAFGEAVEDIVAGAVEHPAHGPDLARRRRPGHRLEHRHGTADRRREAQLGAVGRGVAHQRLALLRHRLLVGADHGTAARQRGGDQARRRLATAQRLDHQVAGAREQPPRITFQEGRRHAGADVPLRVAHRDAHHDEAIELGEQVPEDAAADRSQPQEDDPQRSRSLRRLHERPPPHPRPAVRRGLSRRRPW